MINFRDSLSIISDVVTIFGVSVFLTEFLDRRQANIKERELREAILNNFLHVSKSYFIDFDNSFKKLNRDSENENQRDIYYLYLEDRSRYNSDEVIQKCLSQITYFWLAIQQDVDNDDDNVILYEENIFTSILYILIIEKELLLNINKEMDNFFKIEIIVDLIQFKIQLDSVIDDLQSLILRIESGNDIELLTITSSNLKIVKILTEIYFELLAQRNV